MAGTSPRRSIRARTSQTTNSGSHHSSTSSNSSGRADRNTRTALKTESPRKSTPSVSLSSEPPDDVAMVDDSLQTRRRKRGQATEQEKTSKEDAMEMANGDDEIIEDDEAVRCICGNDEYPGPPQLQEEDSKKGVKDSSEVDLITEADYTEDLAGFFLQCDMCKVWQHGGCVGIKNEDMSPDEYFCELCRKDLHRIFTAPNGQKYSHYLPLYQTLSRTTSRAASFSKDGTRSPRGSKSGRPSSSLQSAKRRSTMNSRDAAYDEEEQVRRAIEASKGEKSGESTDGGTRRGKRGRSDSEEKQEASKRQRTASGSLSPSHDLPRFASQNESDDGTNLRNGGTKRIRGAAARNHREKEIREKERDRAEAANKRKGRADRRRVDDSDPSDETPAPGRAPANRPSDSTTQPLDPSPSSHVVLPEASPPAQAQLNSHKKGGRPPHGRKGKLGKNQYTRDREAHEGDEQSPGRSQSRDIMSRGDEPSNAGTNKNYTAGDARVSKAKTGGIPGGGKSSMVDMKRKVAAMLDFISRTQIDMARESLSAVEGEKTEKMMRDVAGTLIPLLNTNGDKEEKKRRTQDVDVNVADEVGRERNIEKEDEKDKEKEKDFKDLTLLEMMDYLTGELVKWQNQFV